MAHARDITGQRFGRLVVIKRAMPPQGCERGDAWWKCLCDCGKIVPVRGYSLWSGTTKSCGCYRVEWMLRVRQLKGGK